jgi:hypothetical protein
MIWNIFASYVYCNGSTYLPFLLLLHRNVLPRPQPAHNGPCSTLFPSFSSYDRSVLIRSRHAAGALGPGALGRRWTPPRGLPSSRSRRPARRAAGGRPPGRGVRGAISLRAFGRTRFVLERRQRAGDKREMQFESTSVARRFAPRPTVKTVRHSLPIFHRFAVVLFSLRGARGLVPEARRAARVTSVFNWTASAAPSNLSSRSSRTSSLISLSTLTDNVSFAGSVSFSGAASSSRAATGGSLRLWWLLLLRAAAAAVVVEREAPAAGGADNARAGGGHGRRRPRPRRFLLRRHRTRTGPPLGLLPGRSLHVSRLAVYNANSLDASRPR